MAMKTCIILLLATCALQSTARRVKQKVTDMQNGPDDVDAAPVEQETTSNADTEEQERDEETGDYWERYKLNGKFVGLINDEYTQQFEMKEDYRLFKTKRYKYTLDEYEDKDTGVEVRKGIHAKVLTLTNDFFTLHGHQTAEFQSQNATEIGDYTVFNPNFFNRYYTWRVATLDNPDEILFTIQKRLWNDHCKYLNFFKCRPVLKIYAGHRGDKSTLIYYGVGDRDLEEPDFKFYHSATAYKAMSKSEKKRQWVGKVDHKKTKGNGEDKYKIKVKPGEDAGLLLLAAACLDKIGDNARTEEHYEDHD